MNKKPTVASLLPSATEIVAGLIEDPEQLLGVSHECDYPEWVTHKSVLVSPFVETAGRPQEEIDRLVKERVASGKSIYRVDEEQLDRLAPDVVVTQGICDICAASECEVERIARELSCRPTVVSLTGVTLEGIFGDILAVGAEIGREAEAAAWIDRLRARLEAVRVAAARVEKKPRVAVLEWFDPLFAAGHWVPEMLELAGATDCLGRAGARSAPIEPAALLQADPDVILLAGCGYNVEENLQHAQVLWKMPGWSDLSAVRSGRVWALDANGHTCRPGPRVVDGTELFHQLLHRPDLPVSPDLAAPFTKQAD